MEVGQVDEMVTINSTAGLLNTENGTMGTVIENKIVTELPLNGRQYLNLVALSPNVNVLAPAAGQAGARQGGERAQQAISAGGTAHILRLLHSRRRQQHGRELQHVCCAAVHRCNPGV